MRIPKTCLSRLIIWMGLLLPVACGGGGGGTSAPPAVVAPSNLAYSANPASYTKGIAITANTPSSGGGAVVSYAVQPGLPAGLNLSTASGAITGTPLR